MTIPGNIMPVICVCVVSLLSGCTDDAPPEQIASEETVYCVDAEDVIVDDDYCDDDGDGWGHWFFLNYGHHGHDRHKGHKLTSGHRFDARDQQARAKIGLPPTGDYKQGTKGSFGAPVKKTDSGQQSSDSAPKETKNSAAKGGSKKKTTSFGKRGRR